MYLPKVPVLASSDVADLCPITLFLSSSVTVLQHPRPPGSLSDTLGSVSCWAFAFTISFVWKAIPTNTYVAGFIHSFYMGDFLQISAPMPPLETPVLQPHLKWNLYPIILYLACFASSYHLSTLELDLHLVLCLH